MRSLIAGLGVMCAFSTAGDARADVGPAPKCPDGTYSAYLMGRRCVKNGYVLRQNAAGQVEQVPEGKPLNAPEKPVIVEDPAPARPNPPPAATAPNTPPPAPLEKKAGGCQATARSGGAESTLGMFAAVSLLLLARRRRDPAVAGRVSR